MKYQITLACSDREHWISQRYTANALYKAGFTNLKWNMGSGRTNGHSLHRWTCEGDSESVIMLKLSADVEKIEEIKEESVTVG